MGSPVSLPALPQALSPVGRCQSFDAAADGYGRGEGFAAIVLTQSTRASSAGDVALTGSFRALIRGSAVNQDGRSSSLTAPNGPSQQALLGTALATGLLLPSAVGIVAVHGTGGHVLVQAGSCAAGHAAGLPCFCQHAACRALPSYTPPHPKCVQALLWETPLKWVPWQQR